MIRLAFTLFLLFACSFVNSQEKESFIDSFKEISNIFKNSVVQVDILDSIATTPRQEKLSRKIDSVFVKNPEWLNKYLSKIDDSAPWIYDVRWGLSEKDFVDYIKFYNEQLLVSSDKQRLEIIKEPNSQLISFLGEEKLELLKNLRIDLKNHIIYYKNLELKRLKKHSFSKDELGWETLRSDGKGYSWSLIDNNIEQKIWKEKKYKYNQVHFSIFKLERNDRYFIYISESHVCKDDKDIHGCNSSFTDLSMMY